MSVVFLGAGNPHVARMIADVAAADPGFRVAGFLDDDPAKGATFAGYPILGSSERVGELARAGNVFINTVANRMQRRCETSRAIVAAGGTLINFIDPGVDLRDVTLGTSNWIQEGVRLQGGVRIGDNCSLHVGATVSHESVLGNTVFVAPNATLCGRVHVGDGTFIGAGSTIHPNVRVGRWATVAAGAVVMRDVPDGATVLGNPAKSLHVGALPYDDAAIFERSPGTGGAADETAV